MLNKPERQVIKFQLDKEQKALDDLERQYKKALKDIDEKIKLLQSDELTQSRIYQIQYQKALRGQVEGILDKLQGDEYATIQQYLHDSYQDSFIGTVYSLHGQGIPLILPLDQNAAVKAVITDSQISEGLYNHLGVNIKQLKQAIRQEITRGLASNMPLADIARNITNRTKAPLSRAKTIVRTEGHRIQQASASDAREAAKAEGCDVVKQWDGTLDGDTRPTHRRLDGQIRETEEPFEMDGKTAMYPGDFGKAEEDCNCRCVALTRAKWALDEDELKVLKERAKFFELDKAKDFEDFEKKYLKGSETLKNQAKSAIIKVKNSDLANGLPIKGMPNSVVDKTDDAGTTLQRRIYADDGMAHIDFDTSDHGLPKAHPTGAHKHEFDFTKKVKRSKPLKITDEELLEIADIIQKGVNYHDEEGTD